MPLKIVQLNCWGFHYFNEIKEFLIKEKPNIINLQEVISRRELSQGRDFIEELAQALNMHSLYVPWKITRFDDGTVSKMGNAYLTNLEVVDEGCFFDRYFPDMQIGTEAEHNHILELCKIDKNLAYPLVFRETKSFVWSLLKYEGKLIRNITTHFSVSQKCTETLQMIQQAEQVVEFYNHTHKKPTLFSGDLNIHQQSGIIKNLETVFDIVNKNELNSLNKAVHSVFKHEHITNLKVDYIMQNGFRVVETYTPDLTVSDHLPVVAILELDN